MSKPILLHKTLGVNPRMTFCPRCAKTGDSIILLGRRNFVDTCPTCNCQHFGGAEHGVCQHCKSPITSANRRELPPYERLPIICEACNKEIQEEVRLVKAGAIYWKCDCGRSGTVGGDFAKQMREEHKVFPPNPLGVSISACPVCTEKMQEPA